MKGKYILITGASRGIGRYLCGYFAARGAHPIAAARDTEGLAHTAALVEHQTGAACPWKPLDLCDAASITALVEQLRAEIPRLDILVNNAADVTSKPFLETSQEEIQSLVQTNVTGMLQLTRTVVPWMIETGGGSIVNISSLAGYKANAAQTVYSITKAAVNGASDALHAELHARHIHVMNVALASVAVENEPRPGQVPVEEFATALERAIQRKETELYLSPVTKWLMRLYRFYPPLARLR